LCYESQKYFQEILVNVSGVRYNTRMTTKWFKYTWVCNSDCNALIEYTFQSGYTPNLINITCLCGSDTSLLSVDDATIQPTTTEEVKMETTTDNNYMTREFLESQLVQNKARITQLEEHVATVTQRSYTESAERNRVRNEMQEWTLEALDEDSITESQAEEIASICGFELTKEFEIEVSVQYSITVNARNEEQALNAMYDIDFDTVSYNSDDITWFSSSVDRVEVQ